MVESYNRDDSTEEPAPCSKTDAANIFRHTLHTTHAVSECPGIPLAMNKISGWLQG